MRVMASGWANRGPTTRFYTPPPTQRQSLDTANPMIGIGAAQSGSKSNSTSTTTVDFGAKARLDAQVREGISSLNGTRSQMRSDSAARIRRLNEGYDKAQGMISELGGADRQRIDRDAVAQRGRVAADLAGSGLFNSTVLATMNQGVERDRLEAQGQLDQSLREQSVGTLLQRIQGVDSAEADKMSLNTELGKTVAELYARMASNIPTKTTQKSTSTSLGY